jgi:hypothetical protein
MSQQQSTDTPPKKDNTLRQGIAIVVAVIFGISLIAANYTGWIITTVVDQDVFVATLEDLPAHPEVALALAQEVSAGIVETFEVEEKIAETLPEDLAFIASPLTTSVEGLVTKAVAEIIQSDAFTQVWRFALATSHKAATAYIGLFDGDVLTSEEGVAVLDLSTIGAQVNDKLQDAGFDVLEDADVELQIELFELPDSGLIYSIVQIITAIRWAVIGITLGLLALAYGVATSRRRISIWIGGATILAMLVSLINLRFLRSAITGGIDDPITESGALAAWDIILQRFVARSWIVLLLGATVAFAGWVMGDSDRARSVRTSFVNAAQRTQSDGSEPSEITEFVAQHRRLIEWLTVIVGAGILLIGPPLSIGIIVMVIIGVIAIVVATEWLSASASGPVDGDQETADTEDAADTQQPTASS